MGVFEVSTKQEWDHRHALARELGRALVVDFGAEWCGPCRMMTPIFDRLSDKFRAKMMFVRIDASSEVAQSFGIQSLPTFQIWRGGQKVAETIGATQNLEGWLEQHSSPIPSMEPFKGSGRTLAGGGVGTSTPAPQQPSEGTYSTFDDSKPVASLTIRLMDGSRLTGRFNSSHTISDVVKFVRDMRPAAGEFKLMTSFPPKPLMDLEQTLEQAQLLNAMLIQRA